MSDNSNTFDDPRSRELLRQTYNTIWHTRHHDHWGRIIEFTSETFNTIWNTRDYGQLLYLNKLFIKGVLPATRYHRGPLNADSVLLARKLLQIHDYGLFTTDGQGPVHETGHNVKSGLFWEDQQKPYIIFYVTRFTPEVATLLRTLMSNPKLVCIIGSVKEQTYYSNTLQRSYNVTRGRESTISADAVQSQPWELYTNLHSNAEVYNVHLSPPLLQEITEYEVHLAGLEYADNSNTEGVVDVEQALLDAIQASGMSPKYANATYPEADAMLQEFNQNRGSLTYFASAQ